MPVDETTALNITCDNPTCPGNDLDPADRTGWLFISSEVYGDPSKQTVWCSTSCVSAATSEQATPYLLTAEPLPETPAEPLAEPIPEPPPVEEAPQ